jgi:hypothetical protein
MNRAQRRFEQGRSRPSGSFVGELRRRADTAAYREALRMRMTEEANGAPIPGAILEKMTKAKDEDRLWQIMVHDRDANVMVPMGPMMMKDACDISVEAINKQIARGQRRDWTKAEAYPMTAIQTGVN